MKRPATFMAAALMMATAAGEVAAAAEAPGDSAHVPPDPPQHVMGPMSSREMSHTMQMDDTRPFGTVTFDQLEWRTANAGSATAWDAEAWYGGDYNKVWLKTEGMHFGDASRLSAFPASFGRTTDGSADLLWDRIVSRWWNVQAGVRHDFGDGPGRTWAALGVEGVAPYGFDAQATLYLGEEGRSAARVKAEYDVYLTQRLIVQPKIEANLYGRSDVQRDIGAGLSEADLGIRIRCEFRREIAPYVGLNWSRAFGSTIDRVRGEGRDPNDLQFVAGLRIWF
jgi:copper resistance protein B